MNSSNEYPRKYRNDRGNVWSNGYTVFGKLDQTVVQFRYPLEKEEEEEEEKVVFWRRTGFIRWSRSTGYHTRDTLLDLARVTFPKVNIGDRSRCRLMPFGTRCQRERTRGVVGQGEGEH